MNRIYGSQAPEVSEWLQRKYFEWNMIASSFPHLESENGGLKVRNLFVLGKIWDPILDLVLNVMF